MKGLDSSGKVGGELEKCGSSPNSAASWVVIQSLKIAFPYPDGLTYQWEFEGL